MPVSILLFALVSPLASSVECTSTEACGIVPQNLLASTMLQTGAQAAKQDPEDQPMEEDRNSMLTRVGVDDAAKVVDDDHVEKTGKNALGQLRVRPQMRAFEHELRARQIQVGDVGKSWRMVLDDALVGKVKACHQKDLGADCEFVGESIRAEMTKRYKGHCYPKSHWPDAGLTAIDADEVICGGGWLGPYVVPTPTPPTPTPPTPTPTSACECHPAYPTCEFTHRYSADGAFKCTNGNGIWSLSCCVPGADGCGWSGLYTEGDCTANAVLS